MSRAKEDTNVFGTTESASKISDEQITITTFPAISKKSKISQAFSWNREKPCIISEYADKKYDIPFNKVAPTLTSSKCIKKNERQPFVNRPTKVQILTHTTTKLLSDFSLTEDMRPILCRKKKKSNYLEVTERIKFAENLSSASSEASCNKTMSQLNHQNPFNLDLKALSKHQQQRSDADEMRRRKNYQTLRRTMETKSLKTDGVERITNQIRNEKFKMPDFFKFSETSREVTADPESENVCAQPCHDKCRIVSMMEKPKVCQAIRANYQRKERKLCEKLKFKANQDARVKEEEQRLKAEENENLVFHLAEKSFSGSEYDAIEHNVSQFPKSLTYSLKMMTEKTLQNLNENYKSVNGTSVLADEYNRGGIECGQKNGNKIILRSFHDRLYDERRGKINLHQKKEIDAPTCETFDDRLHSMKNYPEASKFLPKARKQTTLKNNFSLDDDRRKLFTDGYDNDMIKDKIRSVSIISPIKQYIQQIDDKLKSRRTQTIVKKSKSQMNASTSNGQDETKRYKRMKFMGIPIPQSAHKSIKLKCSKTELKSIVAKVSEASLLSNGNSDRFTKENKYSNIITSPEDIKLIPEIPDFDSIFIDEEKNYENRRNIKHFVKAQPRGTNPKELRSDKSLPWIEDELSCSILKAENDLNGKSFNDEVISMKITTDIVKKLNSAESTIKKAFNEVIASKLHDNKTPQDGKSDSHLTIHESGPAVDLEVQSTSNELSRISASSLSSEGTNFSNESGSYFMIVDEKIPINELNIANKFKNKSLVTTKEIPNFDGEPFKIPSSFGQYGKIKRISKPPDRFHTNRSRSNAGLRNRIKVEMPDVDLIGTDDFQGPSKVMTDIDEYYFADIHNRRTREQIKFRPITEINRLREIFRMKMDIYFMREKIIIENIRNEQDVVVMEETVEALEKYENFLNDYRDKLNVETIEKLLEMNKLYEETYRLRKYLDELQMSIEPINMRIFFLGNNFVRLSIMQNFQFLLMPYEWRLKNDFLHRTTNGHLENEKDSIKNRNVANLWDRNSISVQTIMDFIYDIYLKRNFHMVIAFPSAEAFLSKYESLENKAKLSYMQFQLTAHKMANFEKESFIAQRNIDAIINCFETSLKYMTKKRNFMQERSSQIAKLTQNAAGNPLEESLKSEHLQQILVECDFIYSDNVLKQNSAAGATKHLEPNEKVASVEAKILSILDALEGIPKYILDPIEKKVRKDRRKKLLQANFASRLEQGLYSRIEQIKRCLAKPPNKRKRIGKLQKYCLKKATPKVRVTMEELSPIELEYVKAYIEYGPRSCELKFDKKHKEEIKNITFQYFPFYLDHYLSSLGYGINIENRWSKIFSEEEKMFAYKDVVPAVRERVKHWQRLRDQDKRDHIQKTENLYPAKKKFIV